MQPAVQPRSAANGFGRRRTERDSGPRLDNKLQTGKGNPSRSSSIGREGGREISSRDRLIYLTTCLIGHHVEVQVLDGSVFSGILHVLNADKDFGIILKMAQLTKDGSRGQNSLDSAKKHPTKTLMIPAKELVQVIAKDVPVTREGLSNELQSEKPQEILIDSSISQSRRADMERELGRWVPEDDDPACPELENVFDSHWDRGWNQFEVNETLFGVKSTFDEDLYTTKLEKGPQMKDIEREASRIAREIEGEDTLDIHLAEERGLKLQDKYDLDEETKYSSVFRVVDDSGYDEDALLDTHNDETFGDGYVSGFGMTFTDLTIGKHKDGAQPFTKSLHMDESLSSQSGVSREAHHSGADDEFAGTSYPGENMGKEEAQTSKPDDSKSSLWLKPDTSDRASLSATATAYAPSQVSSKGQEKASSSHELSEGTVSSKLIGNPQAVSSRVRPGSSPSSTSDRGGATSASGGPGLSPSSSVGSLTSEKSTLNPHAKEFRLNPNAKSYVPSQSTLRPASPASETSFYYSANMNAVPHMHGMPVGIGIGPSFAGHQPVMYNPQAGPTPQPYFHPSGPQYGRQMMIGHPQQVVYMPANYNPEMQYKGREF